MASRQKIHLYSLCWNERRMLPYFFRHYDHLVDHYYIFDNRSTDGTRDLLAAHGRVEITSFQIEDDSFVETERRLSDKIWTASRGAADWVIVVDIDEHLYHPEFRRYLERCTAEGITSIEAMGYEMVADSFPAPDLRLSEGIIRGVPSHLSTKVCVFAPDAITETNFSPGRHSVDLTGLVVRPERTELVLLHYKALGLEYLTARSAQLVAKIPANDIAKGFGFQYRLSAEAVKAMYEQLEALAEPVCELGVGAETEGVSASVSAVTRELLKLNRGLAASNANVWKQHRLLAHGQTTRDTGRRKETQKMAAGNFIDVPLSQTEIRAMDAIERSRLFDRAFYLDRYPDVAASGYDPLAHYVKWGAAEGREPNPEFPTVLYTPNWHRELRTGPGTAPPTPDFATLARRQRELELVMRERPRDWDVRREYFALLHQISRSHFGSFYAVLPEIRTSLLFRGGSSDLLNLQQIFLDDLHGEDPYAYGAYGFDLPKPHRILDLGGYCGYAAVYLANRFPTARIISIEPPGPNFEVLHSNTGPYSNIRALAAAVWSTRTNLRLAGHRYGDWGTHFIPSDTAAAVDLVPAYSIQDILDMYRWDGADLIKCIVEGAQVEILTAADRPWLAAVSTIITRPVAGQWSPNEMKRLVDAYPATEFEHLTHEDVVAFVRRAARAMTQDSADPLWLVPPSPEMRRFEPRNVPRTLSLYRFGDRGLNLTTNPAGHPPASVAFDLQLSGQTSFKAQLVVEPTRGGVKFAVQIRDASHTVADHSKEVQAGCAVDWEFHFAPAQGAHTLLLSTEPVADETGGSERWARLIDARLT